VATVRFTVRYLLRTVAIPFTLNLGLTIALATQVLQLDRPQRIRFAAVALFAQSSASLLLAIRLLRNTSAVERAADTETLSDALSKTLRATSDVSNIASLFGGILFVASRPMAGNERSDRDRGVLRHRLRDRGPLHRLHLRRRKLAMIFIGTFVASTAALVQLVTARVSLQLEKIAIVSSEHFFHDVYDIAGRMEGPMTEERAAHARRLHRPAVFALCTSSRRTAAREPAAAR
jgi:hypothetical protein